jgi:hypothetical protein
MPVFAQTDAQIEKELVSALKDIQTNSSYGGNYDEEKIKAAQAAFEGKLLKHTKSASTLNYKFGELGEHMPIATSEDGRFRIYSWDLMDGGTMRHFARLYQYQSPDGKVYSQTEKLPEQGMGPGFITDIFTLDTKDGKVYIAASTFIASGKLQSQSADLFRIDAGALNDKVNLIKTKSGLTNSVRFEYDNFSVIDRKDRPAKLITFDQKTNTLKIPVVIKDKEYPDGRVTDKFISYKFDGKYFVRSN